MGRFKQLSIVSQIYSQIVSKNDSNNHLKKPTIAKSSQKDDFHKQTTFIQSYHVGGFFSPISNIVRKIYGTKLFFYDFKVKTKIVTFT